MEPHTCNPILSERGCGSNNARSGDISIHIGLRSAMVNQSNKKRVHVHGQYPVVFVIRKHGGARLARSVSFRMRADVFHMELNTTPLGVRIS